MVTVEVSFIQVFSCFDVRSPQVIDIPNSGGACKSIRCTRRSLGGPGPVSIGKTHRGRALFRAAAAVIDLSEFVWRTTKAIERADAPHAQVGAQDAQLAEAARGSENG